MILSEYVDLKISNNQIKYFKEKGYDVKGGNEVLSKRRAGYQYVSMAV